MRYATARPREDSGIQVATPFVVLRRDTIPPTRAFWDALAGEKLRGRENVARAVNKVVQLFPEGDFPAHLVRDWQRAWTQKHAVTIWWVRNWGSK